MKKQKIKFSEVHPIAKMMILMVAMVILGALAGCVTNPPAPPQIEYKLVVPEEQHLMDCPLDAPPSKEEFERPAPPVQETGNAVIDRLRQINANYRKQLNMVSDFAKAQMKTIALCNVQREELRKWRVEQMKIYNQPKAAEAGSKPK